MQGIEISNGHDENSVLIVNDEPDQLTLMGTLLHKAGYSILTAEDGVEGYESGVDLGHGDVRHILPGRLVSEGNRGRVVEVRAIDCQRL